jgi:uncharacterized repeat protein (TIGR03803 family)
MRHLTKSRNFALRMFGDALTLLSMLTIVIGLTMVADPRARAQTYITYAPGSGATPEAGVTVRGDFVYGTASAGGGFGDGVVFEVKHLGDLVSFGGGIGSPEARVVFGPDGHPYGTLPGSGSDNLGQVYNLFPQVTICRTAACQPWRVNVLYRFTGYPSDGARPGYGDLTWDQQGNIYGTTTAGGSKEYGVVYEMMAPIPPSKSWTEKVIWNFTGPDGEYPQNAVIFDSKGNLYGTSKQGGANGFGTVFKLTPSGNEWVETNLYDFQGSNDGKSPIAGLLIDSSGDLYGATSDGGSGGGGTVFELTPSGDIYTFKLLYSFSGQLGKTCGPWGTLTMDTAGSLYGTTYCGGQNGLGSVFKLTDMQNGWTYTSLHDFPAFRNDGVNPVSNVTFDTSGNLWGTASRGTLIGYGVVWMITP